MRFSLGPLKACKARDHQQHDDQTGNRWLSVTERDREREARHRTRQGLGPKQTAIPPDAVIAYSVGPGVVTRGQQMQRDQRKRLSSDGNHGNDAERLNDPSAPDLIAPGD
jgi:hypothetical protein